MSLNMKTGFSSSTENVPNDRKHDNIKSELAKYRMLKSKGAILDANDDIKENKSILKSNTLQTASYQEASYRTALALVQSNSPQTNTANSTLKSDYWASSSKKLPTQSNQSSVQATADSFRAPTSQRDRNATENYVNYYSTPLVKDTLNSSNTANRNSTAVKSQLGHLESTEKKVGSRRSLLTEEKFKEKAMSQIEQFVNSDLENDKIFPKTAHHTSRNGQTFGSMTKSQLSHSKSMKKVPSTGEIRVSSALEMTNSSKNIREHKNYTPVEEIKRKKSLPGSPKHMITQTRTKTNLPSTKADRERKTEGVRVAAASPRCILPTKCEGEDENVVQEEIEKWRVFGKMMAESYDELNKKYTIYMKEKEKDKKVISALKDQVLTLKDLLKEAKDENARYKDLSSKSTSESSSKEDSKDVTMLVKEIESVRDENAEIKKMMEFLKEENVALQHTLEETQKYKDLAEHYQKIADTRFKECSALAEEIICLRTDLDRSHSNYLRIQREQTSAKKVNTENFFSGKKLRQMGEQPAFSTSNSGINYKKWSDTKSQNWGEEADDQPPTPADFTALPSKEENSYIRG